MKNLGIGTRLGVGFGAVILLMIVVAAIGVTRLNAGSATVDHLLKTTYAKVVLINELKAASDASAMNLRNAILAIDEEDRSRFIRLIQVNAKRAAEAAGRLGESITHPKGRELFKAMNEARERYGVARDKAVAMLKEGNKDEAANFLFNDIAPAYSNYTMLQDRLVDFQQGLMSEDGQATIAQARSATMLMVILAAVATVLAAILGLLMTRSITRPLKEAVRLAETVASGDLSSHIEVKSKDETGKLLHALKQMNESLVKIVSDVRTGTNAIATASGEIAAGNIDLSSRTEQQAGSLEETASSMEELTSTVRQNADNARQANQLAVSASEIAVKGGNVVSQVVETMGSINASSQRIVDIISVIDGIAFQTNILALNAAVEAARAGEQGRGFAVVAAEVRSLAQRSAAAAREIKTLIDDSVEKVGAGSRLVGEAGATMDEIVGSVRRVTDIMTEIMAASQEQSAGIEQVNQAIGQMDEVTQQNAALVEEASAASVAMQEQARTLAEVVSVFKLEDAQAAEAAAAEPPQIPAAGKAGALLAQKPAPRALPPAGDEWEQF